MGKFYYLRAKGLPLQTIVFCRGKPIWLAHSGFESIPLNEPSAR